MNNLNPCPSCKSVEGPLLCDRISYAAVVCRDCGMSGPQMDFGSEATDAWDALPRHIEPQPIETAPKDGAWILVNGPDYDCWMSAQWGILNINPNKHDGVKGWSGHGYLFPDATHWLPMPPLPEVK